ncbi:MAG TPA: isoprenylcysteine carboxylmethyltransferase family protein [Terracidiphilus sp.]|nr:isoprenylcysteine carboxylmethyltransferase family protein [Terracidiphilus sp.]
MKDLHRQAITGTLRTLAVLLAATFLPAWTLRYWQGWLCLAAFFIPASFISVWMARNDPELLARRMKAGPTAEKRLGQKVVQFIAFFVFLADFVVPAFDHRFGWSKVPVAVVLAGDVLMLAGLAICFAVARVNSYASANIEVAEEQKVISTGPYAHVRHPLYSGALVMLFGIPLALGSWWGLLVNLPLTAAIVWRLLDEEKFLVNELAGYQEYRERVKWRLVPFAW